MKKNVFLFLSIVWLVLAAGTVGLQPLGSTKSSFTAPGCGVDSQCAWYKISVRSRRIGIFDKQYIDFLGLLREVGNWLMVNKIYTTVSEE